MTEYLRRAVEALENIADSLRVLVRVQKCRHARPLGECGDCAPELVYK